MRKRDWLVLTALIALSAATVTTVAVERYKAHAQAEGSASSIMAGPVDPITASIPCNGTVASTSTSILFNYTQVVTGNSIYKCAWDPTNSTFHWFAPFATSILQTTVSIGGSILLSGACTTAVTTTVTGAAVGKNVLMTPSDGSLQQSGTLAQASVTSTNTVSSQICAYGLISITPTARTYNLQVVQ